MKLLQTTYVLLLGGVGATSCGSPERDTSEISKVNEEMIFGTDNRVEYLTISNPREKQVADATAGMTGATGMTCAGGTCSLLPMPGGPTAQYEFSNDDGQPPVPLCSSGVRFKGQGTHPYCTAFLVAPDTFVTAGHCLVEGEVLNNPPTCADHNHVSYLAIFGFTANAAGTAPTSVPQANVYTCTGVPSGKFTSTEDWAVFKVDRPVTGRLPMVPQYGGALPTTELALFGYPEKLPLKMAAGAWLQADDPGLTTFQASADFLKGNSGGPLVSVDSGVVRGIAVHGNGAFNYSIVNDGNGGTCALVNVCNDTGCPGWLSLTRMSYAAQAGKVPLHPALLAAATL
jgi:Trypsin-like peptidase domain